MYHINRTAIHQKLLVKFSYNPYEILSIEFTLVTLLVFVTSDYYNISRYLAL